MRPTAGWLKVLDYAVNQPAEVDVNEVVVRPTAQS